jgi:hypothetical protein
MPSEHIRGPVKRNYYFTYVPIIGSCTYVGRGQLLGYDDFNSVDISEGLAHEWTDVKEAKNSNKLSVLSVLSAIVGSAKATGRR